MHSFIIKISSSVLLVLSLTISLAANAHLPNTVQQLSPITESQPISIPLIVGSELPESTHIQPSLSALNRYQWQLIQIMDEQGNTTTIPTNPPLTMDIQLNQLLFHNICNHYRFYFSDRLSGDFPYQIHHSDSIPVSCDLNSINSDKPDLVRIGLKSTLQYTNGRGFGFEWLAQTPTSATVALKVDQGKTLIWQGESKPVAPIIGLPITTDLLESYRWRLVSAIDNSNDLPTPISDFYYPDVPILAHFSTTDQRSRVYFDDTCNGVSGSYLLTPDQRIMIGQYPSTDMGCSIERNRIESRLEKLMHNSNSQLNLNLRTPEQAGDLPAIEASQQTSLKKNYPRYNLLQTMDSGETLVWQNESKDKR